MVSQSDWFGSWPLLVPQKVKMDPKMGPKSDILGPQTAQNATCSQSSSKRKIYYNSNDILLYLILNKTHVGGFCVLTSVKKCVRFYVKLDVDKKASWRPQEAEKVPTETFLDDVGPQVEIKRGPRATQNRSKTTKTERQHRWNRCVSSSCSSCGFNGAPFSSWSRFGIDLGSIWGRSGGRCWAMLGRI